MQTFMEDASQSSTDETLHPPHPVRKIVQAVYGWLPFPLAAIPNVSRLTLVGYSFADQALAVGGSFLVNIMLARTQTKEEYGMFALSYSVFIFLSGLYNAAILEPYTVYGSGRYRDRFAEYLRLITRSHVFVCMLLSGILLLPCLVFLWIAPQLVSRALLGLGLTIGVLLSGVFMRRVFYLQREPALAAKSSLVFFLTVACGLWLTAKAHLLDSFSVFLILALGWIAAGAGFGRKLAFGKPKQAFVELEPRYWREHWNYAQWVFATAFVLQFATQGFYWLVAGVLSVEEVAKLRAMYLLIAPMDQVFIAMSYLMLPILASYYARKKMRNLVSLWKRYGLALLGVTASFTLFVRIWGRQMMHFLYAGRFDGLAPLLSTLALLPLLMGLGHTMNDALKAVERPRIVFYAYLCSGSATFLLGIPLVIHFGLRGAVYGMLVSGGTYSGALALGFLPNIYRKADQLDVPDMSATAIQSPAASLGSSPVQASRRIVQPTELVPIALFVYNRAEHTRRTVESLRKNELAHRTDLFVFADGARTQAAAAAVLEVRKYVRSIEGFRSVTIIERERNLGLANSVIDGVTQLCNEFGRVIAVEDDLLTAPDFLTFMNCALERYEDEPRIFSVSGYNFAVKAPERYPYDAFCSYRTSSWGWGTWKNRWEKADWSVSDYERFCSDKNLQQSFNRGGEDLSHILALQMARRIDSWSIRWDHVHFQHNAVSLLSTTSKVYSIGFDGSGVHCRRKTLSQLPLTGGNKTGYRFPDTAEADPHFVAEIKKLHRVSPAKKLAHYFRDQLEGR
jgi:O-antigen/teichoic acid export membrane protein